MNEYLSFGISALKKSRSLIHDMASSNFATSVKADNSLVTDVDRTTEKLLRNMIKERFPQHGIVGEEFGRKNEDAEYIWYLDPIDGTISFSHGIPLYGTILALYQNGTPVLGMIDHPGIDLRCYAVQGEGTFLNGNRITLQDTNDASHEIIATGDLVQFKKSGTEAVYDKLLSQHSLVRTIPDCFGHTLAAKGAIGAMIDFHISDWDIAATKIVIEEAGGAFLELPKTQLPDGNFKHNIICGKPRVVDWLATIFAN